VKNKIYKVLKYFGYAIGGIIAFGLLYLLCAYVLSRITIKEEAASDDMVIYIASNGVHTDIVLPIKNEIKDWSKEVKFENTLSKDTTYKFVGIGWGDKGFYLETPTWADLKASTALKAATGFNTTAMHTTFFHDMKEDTLSKKIVVSYQQYKRLIKYIEKSFLQDKHGHYIFIKTNAVYGKNDAFYEAKGSYSMLHTCNTWTNNALKTSGQRCALWTPFDSGILINCQ
jgi:uncharacterized protein (TIGR02117 family)